MSKVIEPVWLFLKNYKGSTLTGIVLATSKIVSLIVGLNRTNGKGGLDERYGVKLSQIDMIDIGKLNKQ